MRGIAAGLAFALGLFAQAPIFSPGNVSLSAPAGSSTPVSVKVTLINPGPAFNFLTSSNQGWLTVSPVSGTVPANSNLEFTITADPTQKQTGNYSGGITVIPSPGSGLSVIAVGVDFAVTGIAILVSRPSVEFTLGPDAAETGVLNVTMSVTQPYEIGLSVSAQDGGGWLTLVSPPADMTPATVLIRADSSGIDAGRILSGQLQITSPALPGVVKIVPVKLTVVERGPGLTVVPSQMNYYVFGINQPPPQPVQIAAGPERSVFFDINKSTGSEPLTLSMMTGSTPIVFTAQMDSSMTPELPRQDSFTIVPRDGSSQTVVPVKTQLEPARTYAIPQVADGGGFLTSFTVENVDKVAARVSLRFYKSDPATHTTAAWTPPMQDGAAVENISIPVGSSWTVQTAGTDANVSVGWGEVVSQGQVQVGGLAVFRMSQGGGRFQEAAVPINSTLMQRALLPYDNADGYVTSMAVANLSQTEAAKVRVAFRDGAGRILRVDRIEDIPPRGHYAFELPGKFSYLQGQRGTADFWSATGQISLLGLRFSPQGAFTSFEAQTFNKKPLGRRSVAQVADGGGFRTSIVLTNNDSAQANVKLQFWRETGASYGTAPWTLAFTGGENPSSIVIPAGASVTLESTGAGAAAISGWAEVITDQWVTGFAVFRQSIAGRTDQEAAVPVNIGTPLRQSLPFDNTAGFVTAVALANLSGSLAAQVNLIFRDATGLRIHQAQLPDLPANGHTAFRLIDFYPVLNGLKGTMEVSAVSGEVSLMGLRFSSGGAYTAIKTLPLQ